MIKTKEQAISYATKYMSNETLVVSASGNIYANCVIDDVCSSLENLNEDYFILRGERSIKKAKK
jgi:hypothetical protein